MFWFAPKFYEKFQFHCYKQGSSREFNYRSKKEN